ncbi:hypothetical protein GCM10010909_28900 [Acidocella aquatica]|uniref:Transposase n=1 Tax=Acidocella aquatica TaxID=1922313 RepID=A0ABQ6A7M9_9PROT|nr:hypothetical protein GCM10010909_28900 [Acidocella aquatica]
MDSALHALAEIPLPLTNFGKARRSEASMVVRREGKHTFNATQTPHPPQQPVQRRAGKIQRLAVTDLAREPALADAKPGNARENNNDWKVHLR